MTEYILRKYQTEAVEIGVDFFRTVLKKPKHGLMVLPTGSGKSLIVSAIAKELDDHVLVLQPTKEILEQNYDKYMSYGLDASIYSASFNSKEIGQVTFATIGSIIRKKELFEHFKYIIQDEAHLTNAKSGMYKELFEYMEGLGSKICGVTASPYRLSTDGYGGSILKFITRTRPRVFKDLLYYVQIGDLLRDGYLAKMEYKYDESFDSSKIKLNTTGADFNEKSLQKYLDGINQNLKVITEIKRYKDRKGIIVFVSSVADAKYIASVVDNASVVTAKTKKKEREQILKDFKSGDIKAILNVGILQIGFDYPELDTIIISRPTMSLAWYYQAIGRGMRPHPDKDHCLVVDLTDNFKKFGKVEDLVLYENGRKPYIANGDRQLTNVYFTEDSPVEVYKMPFGKFKWEPLKQIDTGYLEWLKEKANIKGQLKDEVQKELSRREYSDEPDYNDNSDEMKII